LSIQTLTILYRKTTPWTSFRKTNQNSQVTITLPLSANDNRCSASQLLRGETNACGTPHLADEMTPTNRPLPGKLDDVPTAQTIGCPLGFRKGVAEKAGRSENYCGGL